MASSDLPSAASSAPPAISRLAFSACVDGQDTIVGTHCSACGYNNFPPSSVCPHCMSLDVAALALSRHGQLYSHTTMRSNGETVFVGYVDLPEKIRVFAELAGFGTTPPVCDTAVELDTIRYGVDDERKAGPVFVFRKSLSEVAAS
ncbi:MAG: zinc ribbon domain-containing protein [Pseudomonadota bacterium]